MKNLNELAHKIHESNKLSGFDVAQDNIGQSLMLIVGEISEAMDAHQCGRFTKVEDLEYCRDAVGDALEYYFEKLIKNTFDDELADIVMRTLDFCASFGVDIDEAYYKSVATVPINVGEVLLKATSCVTCQYGKIMNYNTKDYRMLCIVLHIVETLAIRHDINLEKHIALKMRYNETRPYKHGKRY